MVVLRFKLSKNRTTISVITVLALLAAIMSPIAPALAMGPPGSDCTNRYDGEVVSLMINNGTRTFDVIRDNVTMFDARTSDGYSATVTIEFPAASSGGNSEPGQYWLWTDAFGVRYGDCYDGATAGGKVIQTFNVTEGDLYPNSVLAPFYLEGGTQEVGIVTHWDGNVDSNQDAAYNVTWIANGTQISENNATAPAPQEQPDDDGPAPAEPQPPTTTNNSVQQSTKTTITNKITVNKPITITNVENNNVVVNNVKVNQQVKLSTEVSAPETQTATEQQPVVVLIEIRDGEGYTIFLESRNDMIQGSEPVQLVWTPSEPGSYQTRVFTVDNLNSPSAFSMVSVSQFSVGGQS